MGKGANELEIDILLLFKEIPRAGILGPPYCAWCFWSHPWPGWTVIFSIAQHKMP